MLDEDVSGFELDEMDDAKLTALDGGQLAFASPLLQLEPLVVKQ